jgi:hypothetical protein
MSGTGVVSGTGATGATKIVIPARIEGATEIVDGQAGLGEEAGREGRRVPAVLDPPLQPGTLP